MILKWDPMCPGGQAGERVRRAQGEKMLGDCRQALGKHLPGESTCSLLASSAQGEACLGEGSWIPGTGSQSHPRFQARSHGCWLRQSFPFSSSWRSSSLLLLSLCFWTRHLFHKKSSRFVFMGIVSSL